jgi:hypothetical protein
MVAEPPPAKSAYRNAAVFRSAERLAASAPAKPNRPRAPSRTLIFIVGVACGLGLAFLFDAFAARRWCRPRSAPIRPRSATATPPAARTPATVQMLPPPPAQVVAPVREPTETRRETDVSATTAPAPTSSSDVPATPAVRAKTPAVIAAPPTSAYSLGLTRWPAHLSLEGTLHTPGLPNQYAIVELRVNSTESLAAYFEGTVEVRGSVLRVAPFRVVGTFNGESIVLGKPGEPSATNPISFVIHLQRKNGYFNGTWSLDGRAGTLSFWSPRLAPQK